MKLLTLCGIRDAWRQLKHVLERAFMVTILAMGLRKRIERQLTL
jgi:hypothetical protein